VKSARTRHFKDLPIIAMTANAMAGDKEKVLEAGMWDHISQAAERALPCSTPWPGGSSLKGTAGNIGAKEVQAAAATLEHALLAGAPPEQIAPLLANTLEQLLPVMAGLQALGAPLAPRPGGTETNSATSVAVEAALRRLTALLKDSDADAGDAIEVLQELVKGTPLANKLQRVAAAVADFDFDAALAALDQALA
jgi:CheY-like chemotaxis protein